ncbi:PKD domain-containing protein [Hymenobacter algoricola]|uniref:PKD domain-containing protein n=1 Tax=Hymenobacter algoricola TaxID=486267 RepID=A0ABP7NDW6_9BACT
MNKRFLVLALASAIALCATSCEKLDDMKRHDSSGIVGAQSFITSSGVVYENGLLSFTNQAALDRTVEDLAAASHNPTPPFSLESGVTSSSIGPPQDEGGYDDPIIEDSALVSFERQFPGYVSKRVEIQQQERQLMDQDQWSSTNDPDDFFVDSDVLRTLLNTQLEIKIGTSIFVVVNEHLVLEITNNDWTTLSLYRQGDSSYSSSPNLVYHYDNSVANRPTDCTSEFVSSRASDGLTFSFTPDIGPSTGRVYNWEFGDGIVSSMRAPNHRYDKPGTYVVILRLGGYCANQSTAHTVVTTNTPLNCTTIIPNNAYDFTVTNLGQNFTFELANNYTNRFTYIWDFGDGDVTTYPTANRSHFFYHNYLNGGVYTVRLYIQNNQGCVAERLVQVNVPANECISVFFDRDKEYEDNYLTDKKFKYKLWATNVPFYHRVGVKTKNYEKRKGKWKQAKAPVIYARIYGNVYYPQQGGAECANQTPINDDDRDNNGDTAKTDVALGSSYRLKRQSIRSQHYVEVGGVRYNSRVQLEID